MRSRSSCSSIPTNLNALLCKSISPALSDRHTDPPSRTNFDLRMTLAFTRILLYKPFLHYLARRNDGDDGGSPSKMRLAYACITAAQQAIHHSYKTLGGSLLGQASWPAIYTVFMSITCLVFFLATRPVDAQHDEIQKDAEAGIHVLASAICQGTGGSRCLDVIAVSTLCFIVES